jgi:uncharacterized protein YjbI with pentapeptide repeats
MKALHRESQGFPLRNFSITGYNFAHLWSQKNCSGISASLMRNLRSSSMPVLGLLVVTMILSCPQSALAQDCERKKEVISGKELVEMLSSQPRVLKDCIQVIGDINLWNVPATRGPFILTNSSIEGALIAPSTIFKGTVDFTKTTFSVEANRSKFVDLHGSIFEGDVVWSQAVFETKTISETPPSVDFRGVRFRGITDLRSAVFHVPVQFENTTFGGIASFQQTQFRETVDFDRTAFDDRAIFTHSIFSNRVDFERASMAKDADFTGATFSAVAMFRSLSAMGRLSMQDIVSKGGRANLDRMSVADLKLVNFGEGVELSMADIRADSLEMGLDDVVRIDDDDEKIAVLKAVELTARSKGSSSIANDALFERRVLENKKKDQVLQILNRIFNQGVAGHTVRPLHPLLSVLVVALFGSG